jgi:hypothetical protein
VNRYEQAHPSTADYRIPYDARLCGGGQIKTARPGEQVERHLSGDQTFRERALDSNVTDDIKRIKVCRVEELCKMRFMEGQTPRTRVKNLVAPLRYEDETSSVSGRLHQDRSGKRSAICGTERE